MRALARLLMEPGQLCCYGHSDCTSKKLIILHESYLQELPGSLVPLIWSVDVYATPFLATFHNSPILTHLVVGVTVHFLFSSKSI